MEKVVKTCELVEEIRSREGVEEINVYPYEDKVIKVN